MRGLREIWERPIPADRTLAAFAVVAVVLLATAAVLVAIPEPGSDTPTIEPSVVEATPARQVDADRFEVESVARRFMVGYLQLTTGQAGPGQIRGASPDLTRRLGRPVRVPPAARRRHPRLVEIEAGPIAPGSASVTAMVETGGIAYPVILRLELVGGRWVVTEVGAD